MQLRAEFESMIVRSDDASLSDEQSELEGAFAALLERHCPIGVVRAAEESVPPGFDPALWQRLIEMGVLTMGLSETHGGDGAGLVELVLAAEQVGRRLAPVPFVDAVTALRLLDRLGTAAGLELLASAAAGEVLVTRALRSFTMSRQLVPAGAIADIVVAVVDGALCSTRPDPRPSAPGNLADAPIAWIERDEQTWTALGSAPAGVDEWADLEWRLLTAATLIGVADAATAIAVQYAKDRVAFDVPIGAFQAISRPLVDATVAIEAGRSLVRRAAWFADHEPDQAPRLVHAAFAHAARTATEACQVAIHTHGGVGVTLESDLQLYFRRAKAWPLMAGDPIDSIDAIGAWLASTVAATDVSGG